MLIRMVRPEQTYFIYQSFVLPNIDSRNRIDRYHAVLGQVNNKQVDQYLILCEIFHQKKLDTMQERGLSRIILSQSIENIVPKNATDILDEKAQIILK